MPLHDRRIAIIGTGAMGEALLRGLLRAQVVAADNIMATDRREERINYLQESYGVRATRDNRAAVSQADVVILAVKPQIFEKVLAEIAPVLNPGELVISIAAGITLETIRGGVPDGVNVVRAMPNTPVRVDAGGTAIAADESVSEDDLGRARAIFEAVGTVVQVDESLMDAVTGLSGSGPAFVFMIIEALSDAGVKVGLPRYQAQALAAQTVLGSAKLLIETGEHPGVLKDRVTSPGGTAIAGLHTLEEGGLRTTLINGVVAATARSRELGRGEK